MRSFLVVAALGVALAGSAAQADPVDLSAYADANGFIDVQALTCAQLANTQEDADMLTTWYSGWYNGLAKKHFAHITRGRELEHEVIVYCKANAQLRIIDAIAIIFKDERVRRGVDY